jgi:hypothetical protein
MMTQNWGAFKCTNKQLDVPVAQLQCIDAVAYYLQLPLNAGVLQQQAGNVRLIRV